MKKGKPIPPPHRFNLLVYNLCPEDRFPLGQAMPFSLIYLAC